MEFANVFTVDLENEFSRVNYDVYLDYAGSALYAKTQMNEIFAMYQAELFTNPHSQARSSSERVQRVKKIILEYFETNEECYEVVFTGNATASAKIVAENFQWSTNSKFVYTIDNHTSIVGMREIANEKGASCYVMNMDGTVNEIFGVEKSSSCSHECQVTQVDSSLEAANHLFSYPAESNFSGVIYDLSFVETVQTHGINLINSNKTDKWFVLLDTAKFVANNPLNLSIVKPDFCIFSFYKIFGYPTGLGALLIRKDRFVNKYIPWKKSGYFSGGTIDAVIASEPYFRLKTSLSDQLEEGTTNYLGIASLESSFNWLHKIGINNIQYSLILLTIFVFLAIM